MRLILYYMNGTLTYRVRFTDHGGYRSSDIVLLTDSASDPRSRPTRNNMLDAMRWLVRDAIPGDKLFFHCEFSPLPLLSRLQVFPTSSREFRRFLHNVSAAQCAPSTPCFIPSLYLPVLVLLSHTFLPRRFRTRRPDARPRWG